MQIQSCSTWRVQNSPAQALGRLFLTIPWLIVFRLPVPHSFLRRSGLVSRPQQSFPFVLIRLGPRAVLPGVLNDFERSRRTVASFAVAPLRSLTTN